MTGWRFFEYGENGFRRHVFGLWQYLKGTVMNEKLPLALVGCGGLGSIIAKEIHAGNAGPYYLSSVMGSHGSEHALAMGEQYGSNVCQNIVEILRFKPRYIIEAATADVLKTIAIPALQNGADIIVLSAGALADENFVTEACAVAEAHGGIIHVAGGAIGGFDIAQAAMLAGDLSCSMITEKHPNAFKEVKYLNDKVLPPDSIETIYCGSAMTAIDLFPQNVNVMSAMGFASVGIDNLNATVKSNPFCKTNSHKIYLEGQFGNATFEIQTKPSPTSPRSSALAAYSVVSLLKKLSSTIRFQ